MVFAICDDDKKDLQTFSELLTKFNQLSNQKNDALIFSNAQDLFENIDFNNIDCLILDIVMPGVNGIDIARKIRKTNENIDIIFITSSPEFAIDAYSVYAFNYILKPISEDTVFPVLDKVINKISNKKASDFVIIKQNKDILKVYTKDIEYCEVINKTVYYHLIDGKTINTNEKMSELEKLLLKYDCFIKPHRSFVVNMNYVKSITKSSLVMKCSYEVPIPHGKCSDIKNKYVNYICFAVDETD